MWPGVEIYLRIRNYSNVLFTLMHSVVTFNVRFTPITFLSARKFMSYIYLVVVGLLTV